MMSSFPKLSLSIFIVHTVMQGQEFSDLSTLGSIFINGYFLALVQAFHPHGHSAQNAYTIKTCADTPKVAPHSLPNFISFSAFHKPEAQHVPSIPFCSVLSKTAPTVCSNQLVTEELSFSKTSLEIWENIKHTV